ncbi:class I SAM-dependent methyltransferase [Spongiactinospora sp. TRM90649]|uniref:class I SAM-dependent methyltransferase n=1 Tax=Spongiactinospora sp. TRM90649 TaxID=3031114 RepID=UPI0023F7DE89|nr:class I SAM-dependent methyltransferase [Spongiactinospora sp. TRM90649]MDF5757545.1 class I SAM-dependent methyltransferase [Spongiactinospora sp. TRM90649]
MSAAGDALHRMLFGVMSVVSSRGQGRLLGRYFDWWHRKPDPWNYHGEPYEKHKHQRTIEVLPARPYTRILDVGCSEGTFTHLVSAAYPQAETLGVDISQRALSRAAAGGSSARFLALDILNDSPGGSFDLVFCAETLYYLGRSGRLRQASARLRTLLAPGGLLVLTHPWPEARHLYRCLDADTALLRTAEHVDDESDRPFAITIYQRKADG